MRKIAIPLMLIATLATAPVQAASRETQVIDSSLLVLQEMQNMPDLRVPDWLLQRAEGIAILPQVIKAGIFVGGRFGTGVLLVRHSDGSWSNPLFIGIGAGSFGWQIGLQAADVILVFTTRRSVEGITDGKITLGADASAVAGPVGRSASAATSVTLDAEVYSYSRAEGLFAGISLEGSALVIRNAANERFYGKKRVAASDIISEQAPLAPQPAPALIERVTQLTAAPAAAEAPAAGTAMESAPTTPESDEAKSFPMADPDPGAEPK